MNAKCLICEKPFTSRAGGKDQIYCSAKCRNVGKSRQFRAANPSYAARYKKPALTFAPKPCKQCKENFIPTRNNHVFCSPDCSLASLIEKRKTLSTCYECGARFEQEIKNQRYCTKCKAKQRSDKSQNNELKARLYKEVKKCLVCKEPFTAYRSTSLYCSKICSGVASRSRAKSGQSLSKTSKNCSYCDKIFQQNHPHQRFCSRSCSQMNWHYTQNGQDKRFWTSYRLRYSQVEEILKKQHNGCAICGVSISGSRKSGVHVDHDHSCCPSVPTCGNCNRGLICGNCNTMLGMAKDNSQILENAARYLRNSKIDGPNK